VFWIAWWACLYGLWLLYVDTLAPSELLVGAVAAAIAATTMAVLKRQGLLPFRPRARWFLRARHLPSRLVTDFLQLMLALLYVLLRRPVRSRFRAIAFPVGGDSARASARRAIAAAGGSFTPNTYVVGFDREDRSILLHELMPQGRKRQLVER
jgi:multisubunit Na+/H+ antiporter MnhE subunit